MKKLIKSIIIVQVVFAQMLFAKDLVVDVSAPKSNQPNLKEARNGVPVVDIVKPNNKGLSHNKFTNYNVNKEGLILNNSNKSTVSTHLGGYIFGNPNLAGATAKTILNEVTSKNQTHLKGFTEVAGDRASVVVANPNGIYINGAGFINTHSAILAAGVPNVMDGEVANYMIRGGEIEVDGSGLNTTNVDRVKLYAKAIKLNAQIHAKDLEMMAGDSETWADDENRVLFGIDSTALGGIYANKITLIGTEDGVGVNLPVEISSLDNLKISADGKIVLDKAVSSKDVDIKSFSDSVDLNTLYGDNINIEAKSLTNKKIIAAQKNIDIEAEDSIINKDTIASRGEMKLKAEKIVNENLIASGVDESLKNSNLIINAKSLENQKTIYAKDSVEIDSTDIKSMKDSSIVSLDGQIFLNSKELSLNNTNMSAAKKIDIDTDSFKNQGGSIESLGEIKIASKQMESKDGVILANKELAIGSNELDSFNDLFYSGERVALNASFAKTDHSTIQAPNIVIGADSLKALNSEFLAMDDIEVEAKEFSSNNLFIQAGSNIDVKSSNMDLKNSKLQSIVFLDEKLEDGYRQGDISLTTKNLNLYNTALASDSLNIKDEASQKLQSLRVVDSIIDANKDIDIATLKLNSNNSNYLALGDLVFKVGENSGFLNNRLEANRLDLKVDEGLVLDRSSTLLAQSSLTLGARSFENSALVSSNGDLFIETSDFIVNNSLLSARNILNLNAPNYIVNNDSNKPLFGTRGAFTNLNTKLLTNYGFLSSLYEMSLKAGSLTNYGGIASVNGENIASNLNIEANNLKNYNTIYSGGNIDLNVRNSLLNETNSNIVNLGDEKATIFARDNIEIRAKKVINDKSLIQTQSGDIDIFANSFENLSSNPKIKGEYIGGGAPRIVDGTRVDTTTIPRDRSGYTYNSYTIYTDIMSYDKDYEYALVLSGNDMSLNANSITNTYSLIFANNDLNIDASSLMNNSKDIVKVVTTHKDMYVEERYCKRKVVGVCISKGTRSRYAGRVNSYDVEVIDTINSTIQAGGAITASADKLANGMVENKTIEFTTYDPKIDTAPQTFNLSQQRKLTDSKDEIAVDFTDSSYLLPTNKYGLFVAVDPDRNLDYLIESNPLYANYDNYIGSSYFLEHMGYEGDRVAKRLGDAAYETKLISDEIFRMSGSRFLSFDYESENEQFVALMENGVNLGTLLDLELGKPLTKEQIASLSKNIVWLEERVVDNQTVLVPVLYLANIHEKPSGALIQAKSIELNIEDKLVNSGTIKAKEQLNIGADSLVNSSGVILSNGKATLISNEDFINKDGANITAKEVEIASLSGSIINETYSNTTAAKQPKGNYTYTNLGKTSSMEATSGDLILLAKESISNKGASLSAKDTLLLQTKSGDIDLNAIRLENSHNSYFSGGFDKAKDVGYEVSTLKADNILMQSANDINLEASKLSADNQINLNASNDINIKAVNSQYYRDRQTTSKGTFSKKTKRDMVYKESVNSAKLEAGDILINANSSVAMEAGELKAKDNIVVNAKEGDLNIVAKEYKEGELHLSKKSSWGGLKKSVDLSSSDALKLNSALLKTEAANVVLTSGEDINILASKIESGADIWLKALNDVVIASQSEYLKTSEMHEKSSFNLKGLTALVGTNESIYSKKINKNDEVSSKSLSSTLSAGEDIVVDSGSTTIVGSSLEAKNISIKADTGEINILSSQDIKDATSLDKKVEIKLSNLVKGVTEGVKDVASGKSRLGLEVATLTYDEIDKASHSTINSPSTLIARENLVLDSLTDINIVGSNLKADESLLLNSSIGDINILNSTDIHNENIKEKHLKASINASIQNEYVEIASAVKSAHESAEQLKQTKDDYSNYKKEVKKLENTLSNLKKQYRDKEVGIDYEDIEDLGDFIDDLKSQERYYVAAIAAATADLASKTVAIATQSAAAASSSATWGFSVGVSLDVDGNKLDTSNYSTLSNSSNLKAKNILINTNENLDTNIVGSNIVADEKLFINTGNLNAVASKDIFNSSSSSKNISGSVAFTVYGGGGGTAGLGYGKSNSNIDSLTYNNSKLLANSMHIDVKNSANFIGANLRAEDSLNLNIGDNLLLESVRDEYSSNHKGFNLNAGIGFGSAGGQSHRIPSLDLGKTSSANAGFSMDSGVRKEKQTVLSSITANKVDIDVGGNTHLKGSLIASDSNNLNLTTNTLTFANSSNSSYYSNKELGVNLNYNLDSKKIENQKEKEQQKGISSLGYSSKNSLGIEASKTLATLGEGEIVVKDIENSDDLTRLNRNIEKIGRDLYSSKSGTSVDATLDTRLLNKEGLKQIKDDMYTASAIFKSIEQIVSNDKVGILDFFDETKQSVDIYNTLKTKIANDERFASMLEDPNLNPQDKQNMLQEVAFTVMQELGYISNDIKLIYTDEVGANGVQVKGFYDPSSQTSYINDRYNSSTDELLSSTGHEIMHDMDKQNNLFIPNDKDQNIYATNFGENLAYYTNGALYIVNNTSLASTNNHNSGVVTEHPSVFNTPNYLLLKNNQEFAELSKSGGDDLTIFVHGTFSSPKDADKDFLGAVSKTYDEPVYQFDWSGKGGTAGGSGAENKFWSRAVAGLRLSEFVENYEFKEGETLNIIGHSHGGNVIKDFTQFYKGDKKIDNVVFLGTPVRDDYGIDYSKFNENSSIRNVYDTSDMVQRLGGSDVQVGFFRVNIDKLGIAGQQIDNSKVQNIEVESGKYPISSHSNLNSKEVWEQLND